MKLYDPKQEEELTKAERRLMYAVVVASIVVVVAQIAKAFGAWGD